MDRGCRTGGGGGLTRGVMHGGGGVWFWGGGGSGRHRDGWLSQGDPQDRMNRESPEEAGQGERETQGEVTGQGRPRSQKMVQSVEGGKRRDERERIIVVVRSPCQENYPADAHTSAHKSVLESAKPAWIRSVHLDALCQQHGQHPDSGTANPGAVKQDTSSRGSVDTTKTRSNHRGSE